MIAHTNELENVSALGAALCVGAEDNYSIGNLKAALKSRHMSVLEHMTFTWLVEDISRACSHQLVRHRIASYSQQSQRYTKTDVSSKWYVTPETIKNNSETTEIYTNFIESAASIYEELIKMGIPEEDARMVLPNAAFTKILVTFNARELVTASYERSCNKAQWEIKEMIMRMVKSIENLSPETYKLCGPKCEFGKCPEAKPCTTTPNVKAVWQV